MPALEPYLIEPGRQQFTIEGGYGDDRLVGGRGYDDESHRLVGGETSSPERAHQPPHTD